MRVLVIGGTEFIGREVVRRLVARGHEVAVLHRRDRHDLGPEVGNLQADRADLESVRRILRAGSFEGVIDLAYDWEKGTPAEQVEAAARAGAGSVRRYIFVSSVAAYGFGLERREEDPLAPPDLPSPYAQHKAQAERALFALQEETGIAVATVRPCFVYGPRQPFYREAFFWDRLRDGRPIVLPDHGETPMQWVYVDDVAEVCLRALERPQAAGEAFNAADPRPISQREFVAALGRTAGMEPRLVPVPRERIAAAGGHFAAGNLYFGEYLDLPPMSVVADKMVRLLGVEPLPFDEGLRRSYAWYLSQPRRPVDYSFEDRLLAPR